VVARAVPFLLGQSSSRVTAPDDVALADVARAALRGESLSGGRTVGLYRVGSLAAVVEPKKAGGVAIVLDDRAGQIDDAHADAWREWLRLSNALALRDWPSVITTVTATDEVPVPVASAVVGRPVDFVWAGVFDRARSGVEQDLVARLAEHAGLVPPTLGAEVLDGIPVDLAWPDLLIAVDTDMPAADRVDLEEAGWVVVPPDIDRIVDELGRRMESATSGRNA
jgi:hypothetical protein